MTVEDLDQMECGAPGCTGDHSEIYIEPACHPEEDYGCYVYYNKKRKEIILECAICGRQVQRIYVGRDNLN
jgi:hypothetical protein